MSPKRGAPPALDFHVLGRGPWGTFLYGWSRPVVDRIAYAMARANDPNPTWLDIRDADGGSDLASPSDLGWIPKDHLFFVSPTDAMPQDATASRVLWSVVRSDEPSAVIAGLTDFLRLPPTVQVAVSQVGREPARPVVVIANSDRVRDYYPREPAGVRPIIDAILQAGVLPVFAAVGPPGTGRSAFDFVFEVRAADLGGWRAGSLVCHKAPPGTSLPLDLPIPLSSLPQVVEALDLRSVRPA